MTTTQQIKAIVSAIASKSPAVKLVYLFGSTLGGVRGPLSDTDLAVLHADKAQGLQLRSWLFHSLVQEMGTSRIDIVLLNTAPIELAFAVISHGELLYEYDVTSRVEYEARVMNLYFDYLPVLRAQRSDILKGADHGAGVQRYRKAYRRTQRTLGKIRAVQK